MNPKAYSILFCVLLASTFVHEIRAKAAANPEFRHEVQKRAIDPPLGCTTSSGNSTAGSNSTLSLLANVNASLIVVANLTANASLIIDLNANVIAVLNGTTGGGVLINLNTTRGVYLPRGLWLSANVSLEDYVQNLSEGLEPLSKIVGAVKFSLVLAPLAALRVINNVLICLIANIGLQLEVNALLGIRILLAISLEVRVLLTGVLDGLLQLIGTTELIITKDLTGLIHVLKGLAKIIAKITDGILGLLEQGISLDLEVLINAANGIELLVNLILQVGVELDLGELLGDTLNEVGTLLCVLALLGGLENTGVNGLLTVLATICEFLEGQVSLAVVINVVIQFLSLSGLDPCQNANLDVQLNTTLSALLTVVAQVNATVSLAGLVGTVNSLLNGTLTYSNGVNLSVIINILLTGVTQEDSNLLTVLVSMVIALVDDVLGILTCLLVLIIDLNTPIGIELLKGLGIVIDLNVGGILGGLPGATVNLLAVILGSVLNLVFLLLGGNLYTALASLPVIGKVVVALSTAVTDATDGNVDLKIILNESSLFKLLIKGVFQLLASIRLGVNSTILNQVNNTIRDCSSAFLKLDLNVNITVST